MFEPQSLCLLPVAENKARSVLDRGWQARSITCRGGGGLYPGEYSSFKMPVLLKYLSSLTMIFSPFCWPCHMFLAKKNPRKFEWFRMSMFQCNVYWLLNEEKMVVGSWGNYLGVCVRFRFYFA